MKELSALIVDDNPIQLSAMERQLRKFGMTKLMTCNSGQEALHAVSEHQFDIVFSDIMMPEMDGITLIRNLDNIGYQGALAITSSIGSSIVSSLTYMSKKLGFSNVYELNKPVADIFLEEMFQKEAIIKKTAIKQKLKTVDMDELAAAFYEGQFKNYYQPQLDYTTGKVVGLEALARWVHPTKGMIFPDIFIPMLHDGGLEYHLFKVVLDNVLEDISEKRIQCRVSINVTQQDLEISSFADYLLNKCKDYDVDPSYITLELTEQDIYKESIEMITNVTRMRLYGVGISIDDFGTGSSSYLKLSHLPFTEIKIDKNFVFNCVGDEIKQSIIRSMCTLSKSMHINLVSEGVEDDATWKLMHHLGVDVCQGYFTGRPMPIEALSFIDIAQQ
ncbi:EAL domain-containing response regulator [Vibrio ziniensis]|uniref:EAL domain-containing response regulator n=1 Tax=Vibrio ziniensis TaxID=2711221 RepID=A0A6G7CG56_9VIBR|nr:EAL domain-containing protein [Vibrio ziniensis]QIH41053.1 EAL domain-containing response regulator [Vibrio ziniensis]